MFCVLFLLVLNRHCLLGLQVHVTMQVTPPPTQFKDLIECAGGTFVSKLPTKPEEVIKYVYVMRFLDMSPMGKRYIQLHYRVSLMLQGPPS